VEAAANNLGINKPFLLEEFGMSILDPDDTDLAYPNDDGGRNAPVRDSYFRSAYEGEFLRVISVWAILLTSCFVYRLRRGRYNRRRGPVQLRFHVRPAA
jgi:hypothetical protein